MGNSHRHTIQCMLVINQFNEKMFFFFSVYFFIVGIITFLNMMSWLLTLFIPRKRYDVVRLLVKKQHLVGNEYKLRPFVEKALKTDGILLLHFIKGTAGAFVARDVCTHLFVAYDTPARRRSSSYKPPSPSAPPAPKYSRSGRGRFKPFATGEANPLFENAYNKAMQNTQQAPAEKDDSWHPPTPPNERTQFGIIESDFAAPDRRPTWASAVTEEADDAFASSGFGAASPGFGEPVSATGGGDGFGNVGFGSAADDSGGGLTKNDSWGSPKKSSW
ncbi:innexin-16 [Aphelenchoides avenae]|nr:innexin-16 [Aphelenchus avenae]